MPCPRSTKGTARVTRSAPIDACASEAGAESGIGIATLRSACTWKRKGKGPAPPRLALGQLRQGARPQTFQIADPITLTLEVEVVKSQPQPFAIQVAVAVVFAVVLALEIQVEADYGIRMVAERSRRMWLKLKAKQMMASSVGPYRTGVGEFRLLKLCNL